MKNCAPVTGIGRPAASYAMMPRAPAGRYCRASRRQRSPTATAPQRGDRRRAFRRRHGRRTRFPVPRPPRSTTKHTLVHESLDESPDESLEFCGRDARPTRDTPRPRDRRATARPPAGPPRTPRSTPACAAPTLQYQPARKLFPHVCGHTLRRRVSRLDHRQQAYPRAPSLDSARAPRARRAAFASWSGSASGSHCSGMMACWLHDSTRCTMGPNTRRRVDDHRVFRARALRSNSSMVRGDSAN